MQILLKLRRACFKAGIKLEVVKNTLLVKAMEASKMIMVTATS
jgi:large subunit ribosomal protein L10